MKYLLQVIVICNVQTIFGSKCNQNTTFIILRTNNLSSKCKQYKLCIVVEYSIIIFTQLKILST
jgi:hypothetical protein